MAISSKAASSPSPSPPTPKMAARRPNSPASTSSTPTARPAASASPRATSSLTTSTSAAIIYLYLAESKLRECSIGPELSIAADASDVAGQAWIERRGAVVWKQPLRSGEAAMSHSLANIEHHHFKHAAHRRPGGLHVHFFGASAFSFGDGLRLEDGDLMCVSFEGFGRPLINPLRVDPGPAKLVSVQPL